jgi:hypothetical protein
MAKTSGNGARSVFSRWLRPGQVPSAPSPDGLVAAADTPAHVQVARAVQAVGNASARDIGAATGAVTGNVALAVVPGAALSKVSAVRRLRMASPRRTDDPPQIGWVKELCGKRMHWHSIASWEHGTFRPPRKRRRASSC